MSEAATTSGQYEFSDSENRIISSLAGNLYVVGFYLLLLGVSHLACGLAYGVRAFLVHKETGHSLAAAVFLGLAALLYFALGVWIRRASRSLRQLVQTQGDDIRHLMNALSNLDKVCAVVAAFVLLALISMLVTAVVLVALVLSGSGQ